MLPLQARVDLGAMMLYTHIHEDVSRNIMTTSMNERTHFFIKKYTSHILFERIDVSCEWEVIWRWTQTATYWPQSSSRDHSSTSSSSWLGCSIVGHWGPKPSVWSRFSLRHLISNWNCNSNSNWLTQAVCGTWLYNFLAYASAPNSTMSTGQGDIPTSSTGCTCFRPSAYLHRCIS